MDFFFLEFYFLLVAEKGSGGLMIPQMDSYQGYERVFSKQVGYT